MRRRKDTGQSGTAPGINYSSPVTGGRRTYRNVDGQRVEGIWRHIFIRNADVYFLTEPHSWIGRLLEVVRSELAATETGIPGIR